MLHRAFGLTIRSAKALDGYPTMAADTGGADLDLWWGPSGPVPNAPPDGVVVLDESAAGVRRCILTEQPGGWYLRVPRHCDFVISRACDVVECRPDPDADGDVVRIIAGGLLMAVVLELRGRIVFHASAVALGDRAFAFLGPSGAGKSTVAALMVAAGGRLITDDVLALAGGDGHPHCTTGTVELRLRTTVDPFPATSETSSRLTADGRCAVRVAVTDDRTLPLAQFVAPRSCVGINSVNAWRLDLVEASLVLAANPRVTGWTDRATCRRWFHRCADLAREVPVVWLQIPVRHPVGPELGAEILGRLSELAGFPTP